MDFLVIGLSQPFSAARVVLGKPYGAQKMQPSHLTSHNPSFFDLIKKYSFTVQASLLHAGFFIAAALIGIARYAYNFPTEMTLLMTLWSIILFLHTLIAYRAESQTDDAAPKRETGVFKTLVVSTAVNAVMWGMWTLATDGLDAAPWHMTILLALVTAVISGLQVGKQALYAHWLKTYMQDNPHLFAESKPKRGERQDVLNRLNVDGELLYEHDDEEERRLRR